MDACSVARARRTDTCHSPSPPLSIIDVVTESAKLIESPRKGIQKDRRLDE